MSSRQKKGSGPQSKKPVARPAKASARKGSKPARPRPQSRMVRFETKDVRAAQGLRSAPGVEFVPDWAHPKNVYQTVRDADRYASDIPGFGHVYNYGKTVLFDRAKKYVNGLLEVKRQNGNETMLMTSNVANVTTNFVNIRQSKAAPHGMYPEGGIRLSGQILNNSNDTLGASNTNSGSFATNGAWAPGTAGANGTNQLLGVTPTAYLNFTKAYLGNMFGTSANALSQAAQFHRHFVFRKLGILYEGELNATPTSTTGGGSVQFSYDRDINSLLSNLATSVSTQAQASTACTSRFPTWTQNREFFLINDMKTSLGDKLYLTSASGTGIGSSINADQDLYFQGGIAAIHDTTQPATSTITFARMRWVFVLDLYGFNPTAADGSVTQRIGWTSPQVTDPDERLAYAMAYERYYQKQYDDAMEEIKRIRDAIEADAQDALVEIKHTLGRSKNLKSTDSRLLKDSSSRQTSPCESTTGCGQLDCKECWSSAISSELHLAVKSTLGESKLDDVKLTDSTPPLVIPALVKPVELNRSISKASVLQDPNTQKRLFEWESTISSLRKRYSEVVWEQKRRSAAVLDGLQYVLQPGDKSDAELEGARVGLAEDLRIVREELRKWRNENGLKP